jgi:phosphatidylinositol alpha-mannosyltransferase
VKIGIVSQSYYPRYGGVTEHVHHTAVELRRRGHQVTIITSRFRKGEMNHSDHVERIGYNVLVPFNRGFVDFTVGLTLRQELRRLMREHDFDIVHTHNPAAPSLPVMGIQAAQCPQVATFHSTHPRGFLQDLFKDYLTRTVVAKLDARIAVSKTAEESAQLYYPGHYHIIPNGVDVERFNPASQPFEEWRDPERVNLLFVGRLDPRKGVQYLISAMPEIVARTRGRARLLVIGDSYLRTRLEAMVPGAARDHVHFMGHVPSADLPRWYATGDVVVSPASSHESFGIVLLEALATGRSVVASDIPGYRSVLEPDEHALLVPPGDVPALTNAIVTLVDDPARRDELARRGRARALEFAWPKVTERIEAVYLKVLERRGVAPAPVVLSAAS